MMMQRLSFTPIRLYLASVVSSSVLLIFLSMLRLSSGSIVHSENLTWLVGTIVLIAGATARPVELRPHVRFSLRTAPQLMAAILLGPAEALVATAAGVIAGYIYHLLRGRHNLTDLLFNASQNVLATAAAAIGFSLVRGVSLGPADYAIALLVAAECMHLSNALLVAAAIALSRQDAGFGKSFLHLLRDDPIQYAALLVTGIVGALLAREHAFWAVPLLIVPLALVKNTLVKQREEAERERKLAVMEEVNALKNDFIAGVTHDLRSPLTVIKTVGEFFAEREDELTEDEREALNAMNLSAERLSELVDMLLQLSELDAGVVILERRPSDVAAIVQRVVGQTAFLAEQKGVKLAVTVPRPIPPLDLDPKRFEQVVANLVGNAIKFTPRRGKVGVTVDYCDETLVLRVRDTGRGIAAEALPHIFERFYRGPDVKGERRRVGGLGLAIAKSIVELHGGTITALSRPNAGSTFTIRLPCPPSGDDAPESTVVPERALVGG